MDYQIHPATKKDELDIMVEWAAKEGWNPGLHDADAFFVSQDSNWHMEIFDMKELEVMKK